MRTVAKIIRLSISSHRNWNAKAFHFQSLKYQFKNRSPGSSPLPPHPRGNPRLFLSRDPLPIHDNSPVQAQRRLDCGLAADRGRRCQGLREANWGALWRSDLSRVGSWRWYRQCSQFDPESWWVCGGSGQWELVAWKRWQYYNESHFDCFMTIQF